jgi:hypothetical protein
MRSLITVGLALLVAVPVTAQDPDRVVGGGIQIEGWRGRVDRAPARQGRTVNDSRLRSENRALRLSVGPAGNFWNPSHHAHGNYEVSATFKEHRMASAHPHSYGIFIGGADLESDTETLMYCIAYGNGTYSVKTFHGANVQTLVDRAASDALVKADANGEATNTIGWRVEGGRASCVINGQVVRAFERAQVVAADKLKSLDGNYGIRVSHNVELTVSGLRMTAR